MSTLRGLRDWIARSGFFDPTAVRSDRPHMLADSRLQREREEDERRGRDERDRERELQILMASWM
ncbi:MAG: hypothetical protein AB7K67_14430 [Hyphomicrobiaceae bacterium]|jgi:hypothetical protein